MRFLFSSALLVFALAASVPLNHVSSQSPASAQQTAPDPYVPLRLYNGNWELETSGNKTTATMHIVNHCEQTGLFYVCEQMVNGKSEDLVIFLPTSSSGPTFNYKTLPVTTSAETPGDWGNLEISGDRWVYSNTAVDDGTTTYWRTTNVFSGPDKIHFEIQKSTDGKNWETKQSGDEHRFAK
jgi:hypothetical protein